MKFCGKSQEFFENTIFDHYMTSWNYLKVDVLVKRMVQMVKCGLHKYGLWKGHTKCWKLIIIMVSHGIYAHLVNFSSIFSTIYFTIGHEFNLLVSIKHNANGNNWFGWFKCFSKFFPQHHILKQIFNNFSIKFASKCKISYPTIGFTYLIIQMVWKTD